MHGFLYAFRWLIERLGFLCASFAMLFRDTAAKEYVRNTCLRTYVWSLYSISLHALQAMFTLY